jgi:SNF2 family DNA or RNA helicase
MSLLSDREWLVKYTPDDGDLVHLLYVPALECAARYDRLTGYFQAKALALASRGVEGMVRNQGRMRMLVGCTLGPDEVNAIKHGAELREQLKAHLVGNPLKPRNQSEIQALELLAWMVANQFLEVKVAVPCDEHQRPIPASGIFHEKAGIIEDKTGDRLAFNGSLNETAAGWTRNWESLNVFLSWQGDQKRVAAEEANFLKLWSGESKHVVTMDVPEAAREDLLRFLPDPGEIPQRLKKQDAKESTSVPEHETEPEIIAPEPFVDHRRLVWGFVKHAAKMPNGGERVGEATANVTPWPHQVRAFQRLYAQWPPRLLIADEVGLGKTIQAGMLLRQTWLAEKARRVLVLAPASICKQWQLELREKFNLSWPIYDGEKLVWLKSPGRQGSLEQAVPRSTWHEEPAVIVSHHLMRRAERQPELLLAAKPWDLVIVDEAHHARRKAPGQASEGGPNALLKLLLQLRTKTQGLVLMTATPMQVHPVEVWDLLALLGLPPEWHEQAFLRFCEAVEHPSPSNETMEFLAGMFRVTEHRFGVATEVEIKRLGATSSLQAKKVLSALRDASAIPRRQMEAQHRGLALRLMKLHSPIGKLISRHTRDLLRRYHKAGKLTTPIADREVEDRFADLSPDERSIYDSVEDYISTTYNQAAAGEKNAVGFVMTIYRRRLASSFAALRNTLEDRLQGMETGKVPASERTEEDADVEPTDPEAELFAPDEAEALKREVLAREEKSDIAGLLERIRQLPPDTKAKRLQEELDRLRADGYAQAMVFTQYSDTMDFLRERIAGTTSLRVMCFSGRGGEIREQDGSWKRISRDEAKKRFREGKADILVCTDAAAEGLNFQFCGALLNYDMPWNPMRVEQRIGRIDRLGQKHAKIRIVNLHYSDTVEADVYIALRKRIGLFESVVGRLQPILARLPSLIAGRVLDPQGRDADARSRLQGEIDQQAEAAKQGGFDLDAMVDADLEEPPRPAAKLSLLDLDHLLLRPDLLPPGFAVKQLQAGEFSYQAPGMSAAVRVTTRPDYFDAHSESVELWSPGSPQFPAPDEAAPAEEISGSSFAELIKPSS